MFEDIAREKFEIDEKLQIEREGIKKLTWEIYARIGNLEKDFKMEDFIPIDIFPRWEDYDRFVDVIQDIHGKKIKVIIEVIENLEGVE